MARDSRRDARRTLTALTWLVAFGWVVAGVHAHADDRRARLLAEIAAEPMPLRAEPVEPMSVERAGNGFGFKTVLKAPVRFHQTVISPQDGDNCTFVPTCSEYARQALSAHGALSWAMAADRLTRCYQGNHAQYEQSDGYNVDPVVPSSPRDTSLLRGALSIVPGVGQMADGRWKDGLIALGTVGLFAFGAAHYADRGETVPATLSGGFALFYYGGNLYGGSQAFGRAR